MALIHWRVRAALAIFTCCVMLLEASSCHAQERQAYVSLLYGDNVGYAMAARVLAHSIAQYSQADRLLLVTEDVPAHVVADLERDGWQCRPVTAIDSPLLPTHPRWRYTFTKLELWHQLDYDTLVYLDLDMVVMNADLDRLFDMCPPERPMCAASDMVASTGFNSGMMVIHPDAHTYQAMLDAMAETFSFDGADQGFLNAFFHWFEPDDNQVGALPLRYNAEVRLYYVFNEQLWKATFHDEPVVLHYNFGDKPWGWRLTPFLRLSDAWFNCYAEHIEWYDNESCPYWNAPFLGWLAAMTTLPLAIFGMTHCWRKGDVYHYVHHHCHGYRRWLLTKRYWPLLIGAWLLGCLALSILPVWYYYPEKTIEPWVPWALLLWWVYWLNGCALRLAACRHRRSHHWQRDWLQWTVCFLAFLVTQRMAWHAYSFVAWVTATGALFFLGFSCMWAYCVCQVDQRPMEQTPTRHCESKMKHHDTTPSCRQTRAARFLM
jgi:hypothetical protein